MKLEGLTEEHLLEIIRLYEDHCGYDWNFERAMSERTPGGVLEKLKENGSLKCEIASRWNRYSEIFFEVDKTTGSLQVRFNTGLVMEDGREGWFKQAEKFRRRFEEAAKGYLESH